MNTHDLPNWIKQASSLLQGTFKDRHFTIKEAEEVLAGTDVRTIRIIVSRLSKSGLLMSEPSPEDSRLRFYSFLTNHHISESDPLVNLQGSSSPPRISSAPRPGKCVKFDPEQHSPDADIKSLIKHQREEVPSMNQDHLHHILSALQPHIKNLSDLEIFICLFWLKQIRDESVPSLSLSFIDLLNPESQQFLSFSRSIQKYRQNSRTYILSSPFSLELFSDRLAEWLAGMGQFGRKVIEPVYSEFFSSSLHWQESDKDLISSQFLTFLYSVGEKISRYDMMLDRDRADLMTQIACPSSGDRIYCPATGYGDIPAVLYQHLQKQCIHADIYAESFTATIGKRTEPPAYITGILLDIFNIYGITLKSGDFIRHPGYWDPAGGRFDLVIGRIPQGMKGYTEDLLKEDETWPRFRYGFPSRRHSDWLFIQHCAASMNETGKTVLMVSADSLFRKGSEADIRTSFMKKGLVEGIILLPGKNGMTIDAQAMLVLNAKKPASEEGVIFCIDATKPQKNSLHPPCSFSWVTPLWSSRREEQGISRMVPLEDILKQGGVISIPSLIQQESPQKSILYDGWRWEPLTLDNHRITMGRAVPLVPNGLSPVLTPDNINERGYFSLHKLDRTDIPVGDELYIPPGSVIFSIQEDRDHPTTQTWYIDKVSLTGGDVHNLIGGEGIWWIELTDPSILSEYLGLLLHLVQSRVRFTVPKESLTRTGLTLSIPVPPIPVQIHIVKTLWKDTAIRTFLELLIQMPRVQASP